MFTNETGVLVLPLSSFQTALTTMNKIKLQGKVIAVSLSYSRRIFLVRDWLDWSGECCMICTCIIMYV